MGGTGVSKDKEMEGWWLQQFLRSRTGVLALFDLNWSRHYVTLDVDGRLICTGCPVSKLIMRSLDFVGQS